MKDFIVNIKGPDDIHEFESEIEAHKFANDINKASAAWNANKKPDHSVMAIALVYTKAQYKKLGS